MSGSEEEIVAIRREVQLWAKAELLYTTVVLLAIPCQQDDRYGYAHAAATPPARHVRHAQNE